MTGCVYYVVAGIGDDQPICSTGHLRSLLCESLVRTAEHGRHDARHQVGILAYCVDCLWVRAVLDVPNARELQSFFRAVAGEYEARREDGLGAALAATLFGVVRSVRLSTPQDCLSAVRHCHLAPVQLGLARSAEDWQWGSHRSYLGLQSIGGLSRSAISRLISGGPGGWPLAYQHLVSRLEPGERVVMLPTLNLESLPDAEDNGDRNVLSALSEHPRARERDRVFRAVVVEVCDRTGCDSDEFMRDPAHRRFRLQRALLLEEFTVKRRGVLSVHELALRLHSDRSWLYHTRRDCRLQYPELFADTSEWSEQNRLTATTESVSVGSSQTPGVSYQHIGARTTITYEDKGVPVHLSGRIDLSPLLTAGAEMKLTEWTSPYQRTHASPRVTCSNTFVTKSRGRKHARNGA